MCALEGLVVLQASLLLVKSLNETETPILSVVCSLFPKAVFLAFGISLLADALHFTNGSISSLLKSIQHIVCELADHLILMTGLASD